MPGNRRVKHFLKCIVEYIELGGASCPESRRVKYFYKVYFEIY
jgi:hypothetical protein